MKNNEIGSDSLPQKTLIGHNNKTVIHLSMYPR